MVTVLVWRPRAWRRTSAVESVLRQPRGRARSTRGARRAGADWPRTACALWDVCERSGTYVARLSGSPVCAARVGVPAGRTFFRYRLRIKPYRRKTEPHDNQPTATSAPVVRKLYVVNVHNIIIKPRQPC